MASALTLVKPKEVESYTPQTYTSQYDKKLNSALNTITNWKYDPMKDASYQALAKIYGKRGNLAAKNTLADAASLNGGLGTSYAVSAAQQARNQYNQELAALIPDLENAAYQRAQGAYNAYRDADDTAYGRFRDTEGDRQWLYNQNYQKYRDLMGDYQWGQQYNYNLGRDQVADNQWNLNFNYQKERDKVADEQWNKNYALDLAEFNYRTGKAGSGGSGGGGGGRSYGGSGGYNPLSAGTPLVETPREELIKNGTVDPSAYVAGQVRTQLNRLVNPQEKKPANTGGGPKFTNHMAYK